jgi:hypothetical protein
MFFSTLAGVLGALGAVGVILALTNGGAPMTVPPLVFLGAPIMSVIVASVLHPPKAWPQWPFYVGIVLAAAGASLILRYKPAMGAPPAAKTEAHALQSLDAPMERSSDAT